MKGARGHYNDIMIAGGDKKCGFQTSKRNFDDATFKNGLFLFILGHHARGVTLEVFMFKNEEDVENVSLFDKNNALHVYGKVFGNCGWDEEYGFLVGGKIKEKVQEIFNSSTEYTQKKQKEIEENKRLQKYLEEKLKLEKIEYFQNLV